MAVKIVIISLLMSYVHGSNVDAQSDTYIASPTTSTHQNISMKCFDCICKASSDCDLNVQCNNGVCGPFSIAWLYWSHAGQFTINDESPDKPSAYAHCANDLTCATKVVQSYMDRFAQDCNGDGVIDCDDYARIHHLGSYECSKNTTVDAKYVQKYRSCMKHANDL